GALPPCGFSLKRFFVSARDNPIPPKLQSFVVKLRFTLNPTAFAVVFALLRIQLLLATKNN
ncbi:MAG: hypothetical protein QW275_03000, partial [Candidatus Anstonellaceae archaeon]